MTTWHRGWLKGALIAVLAGVTSGACTKDPTPPPAAGSIRIEAAEPGSLDPPHADDPDEIMIVRHLFRGLVDYDPKTAAVRPASAKAWVVDATAKQFTFRLRTDNKFADGEAVKADSFVRAFNRAAAKAERSELAEHFAQIVGYDDLRDGRSEGLRGVRALDDFTLRITLTAPDAEFVTKLGHPVFSPIPSDRTMSAQRPSWAEHPVGNGPLMVRSWRHNENLTLVPNPHWYGKPWALTEVAYVVLSDLDLAFEQWQKGNLDWTRVPSQRIKEAETQNPARWVRRSTDALFYLAAVTDASPTRNRSLRRAISQAIDRKSISEAAFGGLNATATGIVPPTFPGYRKPGSDGVGPCKLCVYDPVAARKDLADGKVPSGIEVVLTYPQGFRVETWIQRIADQLRANLGIKPKLVAKRPLSDYLAGLSEIRSGALGALSWRTDFPGPDGFLSPLFRRDVDENYSRFSNAEFETLMASAHEERDPRSRTRLFQEAEDLVLDELPIIPLWWEGQFRLANLAKFDGLTMDAFGYPTLELVRLKARTG